jgi:hypothetical protein
MDLVAAQPEEDTRECKRSDDRSRGKRKRRQAPVKLVQVEGDEEAAIRDYIENMEDGADEHEVGEGQITRRAQVSFAGDASKSCSLWNV